MVFAAAGATAVAAFHEVDKVVTRSSSAPAEARQEHARRTADSGQPQTTLILGSDRRPKAKREVVSGARSDTIMLVRLNPDKEATAIMSLPRDLKVRIPAPGVEKIDVAYEYGGPALTLRTVKHSRPPDQPRGERDVQGLLAGRERDRLRVHRRGPRLLQRQRGVHVHRHRPGYQRLCARQALQYVRFGHFDTDLVRSARKQEFLRRMKQQVTYTALIKNRDRLVQIFGRNTATAATLRSRSEVLRLVKLAVFSAGQPIQEIDFEGEIGRASSRRATRGKEARAAVLNVQDSPGPRGRRRTRRPRASRSGARRADSSIGVETPPGSARTRASRRCRWCGGSLPVLYQRCS